MESLRFDFVVKPTDDGKSNIICITSIATADGKIFVIQPESQPANLHKEITNTSNLKNNKIPDVLGEQGNSQGTISTPVAKQLFWHPISPKISYISNLSSYRVRCCDNFEIFSAHCKPLFKVV